MAFSLQQSQDFKLLHTMRLVVVVDSLPAWRLANSGLANRREARTELECGLETQWNDSYVILCG